MNLCEQTVPSCDKDDHRPEEATNRILVVDDNKSIQQDYKKILNPARHDDGLEELEQLLFGETTSKPSNSVFDLSFASQGMEACELVQAERNAGREFHMAFVDMRMPPGWDGMETIKHMWEIDPRIYVVICTAYSDRDWSEIAEELNAPERLLILKKPFDDIEVTQLAESLCQKWNSDRQLEAQQEQMKQEIEVQRDKFEAAHQDAEQLVNSIIDVLIAVDGDLKVTRWNPPAEECFGIPAEQALGRSIGELPVQWQKEINWRDLFSQSVSNQSLDTELSFRNDLGLKTLDSQIFAVERNGGATAGLSWRQIIHSRNFCVLNWTRPKN